MLFVCGLWVVAVMGLLGFGVFISVICSLRDVMITFINGTKFIIV